MIFLILFLSFFSAVLLTGLLYRYALHRSLIDIPNERSSHTVPVPRGGGFSIVLITLLCLIYIWQTGYIKNDTFIALTGGGLLIAAIGWMDDHRDVVALSRAIIHFIASIWTIMWLGGLNSIDLGFTEISLGWFGSFIAVVAMVWLINLYNFMDGTDGIAAVQAITAGVFSLFFFLSSGTTGLAIIILALVGATTGFLIWNWFPARIFMGDVGSSFLGYLFAALAILGEQTGTLPILIWTILLALFIWDTTLTLISRIRKGEKWYSAHRSHAYQRFVQMGNSHEKLALWFLLINIMILWPVAWVAIEHKPYMLLLNICIAVLSSGLWLTIRRMYARHHQ